jgi:hypothetical protein
MPWFKETLSGRQDERYPRNKIAQRAAAPYDQEIDREGAGCGESSSTVSTVASCGIC